MLSIPATDKRPTTDYWNRTSLQIYQKIFLWQVHDLVLLYNCKSFFKIKISEYCYISILNKLITF